MGQETHATSSPKSLIFLWQVSSRERREEEALLELPAPVPAPPWCTGVGGAETVVAEDATAAAAAAETDAEAEEGSRRTVTAPRAGERSIVVVVFVVAIVVVEDDLLGAPPSCPRIRSRTLGRHQILFVCHRTMVSTRRDGYLRDPSRDRRRFTFDGGRGNESEDSRARQIVSLVSRTECIEECFGGSPSDLRCTCSLNGRF